jgi:hypothetical protein
MKIGKEELSALRGLPYLQQLLYLTGLKPYIDYRTGLVGIKRKISYQSLAEELYIEPHQGIKSGSPSKDQIRRAIKGLERSGLLHIRSQDWQLIFYCPLALVDNFNLNKAAIKQHDELASVEYCKDTAISRDSDTIRLQSATICHSKATIPHKDNYYVFLLQQFEKFWNAYPVKKSKQKTWEQFQALQPTEDLILLIHSALHQQINSYNHQRQIGQWVPKWKFPANWLAAHCWNDEIQMDLTQETNNAIYQKRDSTRAAIDPFWDSCKSGAEYVSETSKVIELCQHRKA